MGQISLKKLQKKRKDILEGSIEENIICPFCSTIINSTSNYDQLNNHLQECGNKYYDSNYKINHEIYSVKEDQNLNKLILNEINIYKNNIRKNDKENMDFNIKIDELHK